MLLPLHLQHPSFSSRSLDRCPISFRSPHPLKTVSIRNPKPHSKPLAHISSSACSPSAESETVAKSAIQRIAEKLRNLGYVEDEKQIPAPKTSAGEIFIPSSRELPKHRIGHTIDASWSTPENPVPEPGSGTAITRYHEVRREMKKQKESAGKVKKEVQVPTLAELTIPAEELSRLRGIGIRLDKRLKIGKAGITEGIVNGIHERWRRSELVKIKCEDLCRMNMRRTHETLERRTGGLVVWRSGSIIILYRGANYVYPYFLSESDGSQHPSDKDFPESSDSCGVSSDQEEASSSTDSMKSSTKTVSSSKLSRSSLVFGVGSPQRVRLQLPGEAQLQEEADCLLDGLGPRFTDWWGYDPQPVDADLLPAVVPGFRKPFRLLPYGVQPKLTDREMTILRRLGRPLPYHFALGRNRNLQGLAASMVKLWERCEIAKIAIKRGVQNTNSEMMAEELKRLTGGTLLSRDKEFIVFYRGKDFLPPAVSAAIEERRKYEIYRDRQKTEQSSCIDTTLKPELGADQPASVNELKGANDKKRDLVTEQRNLKQTSLCIKSVDAKLSLALERKEKAEKILEELEKAAKSQNPEADKEGISEEERYVLRKVGLRMKPFLLLGRRRVFDGTIENMHLHWKYRELVKIISNDRHIEEVYRAAQTLEAESGGILVAVERVSKGHAIIVYRGKNYRRPATLRPRTLLNKKEAMKRSLEAQRHESLKLHVLKLNKNIDELKHQLVHGEAVEEHVPSVECKRSEPGCESAEYSGSLESAYHQEDVEAKEEIEPVLSPMESIEWTGGSSDAEETTNFPLNKMTSEFHVDHMQDEELDSLPKYEGQYYEDEPQSSSEEVSYEVPLDGTACSVSDGGAHVYSNEFRQSKFESAQNELDMHINKDDTSGSDVGMVFRSAPVNIWDKVRINAKQQGGTECSVTEDEAPVSGNDSRQSSLVPVGDRAERSASKDEMERSDAEIPFRASPLSNRERLILRKQALKMKKRPVLAIGRNNIVTGVAKAIRTHFRKNPLAIVNVKGRAKGTSVQELVFKLEEATGGVLVSQEPCKVILYRGWGEGEEPLGVREAEGGRKSSAGGEGQAKEVVSSELLAAIKLECGLNSNQEEETAL